MKIGLLIVAAVWGNACCLQAAVALEMDRGKPGEAKPLGWLKAWSRQAADGYAGCMDDVDPEFARAWKAEFRPRGGKLDWMAAPDGSWSAEGGAYWFDGLVRLAEQLDDPSLRELAKRRIEPVLDNMNAKSVLFNWWLNRDNDEERGWVYRAPAIWQMWASGISERAIAAYLDVTGDVRAKRALTFAFDDPRLFTEATVRKAPAGQAVFEAAWLTGDAGVHATADAAAKDPMPAFSVPPKEDLTDTLHWKRPDIRKARATRHGVTTAEALLSVLRAYRWSGERKYLDAVLAWFAFLDRYALQPYGVTVSDEEWGWAGASRGSETCTVAAEPWTRTELMMLLGDGAWGDAVERAFFNAAPNCVSHDFRRHVYLQTANRTDADDFRNVSAYRDFVGMKEQPTRFARKHYPLCCTAALNRLIPNYVQSMWMKTADGGVAAALYGPSSFATDLPSGRVALRETTDYPFSETIRIAVESAPASSFALKLRIPGWCADPAATLNGAPLALRAERGFASVVRTWQAGDELTLRLPMRPKLTTLADRNEGGRLRASVSCGPLLYAFAVPEKDENTPQAGWTEPTLDNRSLEGAEVVRTPLPSGWSWSREAPVRLKVRDSNGNPLELVPYACAKLRISLFPMASAVARPRVAKWIAHPNGGGSINWGEACLPGRALIPTPVFRRRFTLEKPLAGAELYVTGLGFFEVKIDGRPVTDGRLMPAPSAYDRRWRYRKFALSELAAGTHVVSVLVGNGFYCEWRHGWNFDAAPWIDHPKMFLEIEDASGQVVLASDETWKAKFSPIVCTGLRGGEDYDARLEFPEDETEGKGWRPALVKPGPGGIGEEEIQPPCRAVETHPMTRQAGSDIWVSPVAVAGVPRLTVRGEPGAKVTLRCGEYHRRIDDKKGTTNETQVAYAGGPFSGGSGARWQVDSYVLKGAGEETWEPRFTYHGFDRIEAKVEGVAEIIRLDAIGIHTDFTPNGTIETSDMRLQRLLAASSRAALANFVGIPTDCPHREKIGWLSEARIQSEFLLYGWSCESAYAAYVDDIADVQRPSGQLPGIAPTGGWGYNWGTGPMWWCAFPLIADSIGRFTGDWSVARRTLAAQKRQSAFIETVTGADGLVRFGLPDWCVPNGTRHRCPNWFSTTAFAVAIHAKTASFCERFGDVEGAQACRRRAAAGIRALQKAFYKGEGRFSVPNTTMHALALEYDIVPAADRAACAAELNRIALANGCRPDYGTGGAGCVVQQLFDQGYADTAFAYMVQPECPGYQVWFDRWHLTALPESWDPDRVGPGADSRFHGVFSSICDTMYRSLAGFRHDADLDGAKEIRIRPCFPSQLRDFAAEHAGYRVAWTRTDGKIKVEIVIPEGKSAEVVLPGMSALRRTSGRHAFVVQ